MRKRVLSAILITSLAMVGCGRDAKKRNETEIITERLVTEEFSKSVEVSESEELSENVELPENVELSESEELSENAEISGKVELSEAVSDEPDVIAITETLTEVADTNDSETIEVMVEPKQSQNPHICAWDGGTVTVDATCNTEGIKTYQCVGCSGIKNESIAKKPHVYISENTTPTCTDSGNIKIYCVNCGDVQSEEVGVAATGHVSGEKMYWPSAPTCTGGGYYNICCSVCGEVLETGSDPALPHTEIATEIRHGDCVNATVISIDCGVCGHHLRNESHTEEHNWVLSEATVFNEETLEWESTPIEYCTVCSRQKQ